MARIGEDKNIGKDTRFPHNDPTKGGRRPKIYNILKDKGYSKEDVRACFGELSFYTKSELNEVLQNKELPIIQQIVANQFLEALKGGDWGKIKEILEHSIGKPTQPIEQTNDNIQTIIFKEVAGKDN